MAKPIVTEPATAGGVQWAPAGQPKLAVLNNRSRPMRRKIYCLATQEDGGRRDEKPEHLLYFSSITVINASCLGSITSVERRRLDSE